MKKTIYELELENGKYYVGIAKNSEKRILQHFENNGSAWTKLHKPIRILRQFSGDEFDEEKYTLLAMNIYGIDNVRGGSYCKVNLSTHDKNKALQTVRSITNTCYKCGEKGHYADECTPAATTKRKFNTRFTPKVCVVCNKSAPSIEVLEHITPICITCANDVVTDYDNITEDQRKELGLLDIADDADGVCDRCDGTGYGYWTDDVWGACMFCSADKIDDDAYKPRGPFVIINKNALLADLKKIVLKNKKLLPMDFTSKILQSD
jgi:hypothetical protein